MDTDLPADDLFVFDPDEIGKEIVGGGLIAGPAGRTEGGKTEITLGDHIANLGFVTTEGQRGCRGEGPSRKAD